jgi:hypothetical protein
LDRRRAQVIELDFRDRRIDRNDEEHCTLGKHLQGRLGVVLVRGTDAGRVDQHRTACENLCGVEEFDSVDPEAVFRIGFLGDETEEKVPNRIGLMRRALLERSTVFEPHANERLRAPRDKGGDRRQRDDRHRQNRHTKKRVEKGALPALELPENGQLQAFMFQALTQIRRRASSADSTGIKDSSTTVACSRPQPVPLRAYSRSV